MKVYDQKFQFVLIVSYIVDEILYFIKRRNERNKNTYFYDKKQQRDVEKSL